MGNTIIYNGQEYGNPIVNDTGVGEFYPKNTPKSTDSSNNEIFNSYGGVGVNTIESVEENGITRNSTYGHAEGLNTHIYGADNAHVEGCGTEAKAHQAHAEGLNTKAYGYASHAEGASTYAAGSNAHAEGNGTMASGDRSHAEGDSCIASGEEAHAEGQSCTASGTNSHAEGYETLASGSQCHAEGCQTKATVGTAAHAEGLSTEATGSQAHAEGYKTKATDFATHAEGSTTLASYSFAHAEGYMTIASSTAAHAEGRETTASNSFAHTEGCMTTASGHCTHAEGQNSQATGAFAHAQNLGTIASVEAQTAIGKYNATNNNAALIIGNGTGTIVYNIDNYDDTDTYSIGNKVKREVSSNTWKIYECIEAVTTAEPFDSSKWTDITDNYIISRDGNTIYETNRSNIFTVEWNGSIITGQQSFIDSSHSGVLVCGSNNTLNGGCDYSTIEGTGNTIEFGSSKSHIEGESNQITGGSDHSHIEGGNNIITGGSGYSHIEGKDNIIGNGSNYSHAEGKDNIITEGSDYCHIEGKDNIIGNAALQCHVQNLGNVASSANQTVIGQYNQPNSNYALIIGNGQGTSTTESGVGQYNQSSSYAQDAYCYYNGLVWKCIEATPNPAGLFDNAKWEVQNATYDSTTGIATLRASSNALTVSWDGVLNVIGQNADIQINGTSVATGGGGDVANPNISDAYSSSATYAVGAYCIYNDNLYKCNTAITVAENWTAAHWTQTTVGAELLAIINRVSAVETALNGLSFSTTTPTAGSEDPNTIYFLT